MCLPQTHTHTQSEFHGIHHHNHSEQQQQKKYVKRNKKIPDENNNHCYYYLYDTNIPYLFIFFFLH